MARSSLRANQFSLRTLLLIVTVAAFGASWYALRRQRIERQERALEPFRKHVQWLMWGSNDYLVAMDVTPTRQTTDQELENLREFVHLESLTVRGSGFTDATLAYLAGLDQLQDLCVLHEDDGLSDAGLLHVRALSSLRCLSYGGSRVSDAGLRHLQDLCRLERLLIDCREASDKGLESLVGLRCLRHLSLTNGSKMTGEGLAALPAPGKLESLRMEYVSEAGMRTITRFSNLRKLAIQGGIGDESAPYLAQLRKLRALDLEGTAITAASMPQLLSLGKLEELTVPFPIEPTPELREQLAEALPRVTRLKSANGEIQW